MKKILGLVAFILLLSLPVEIEAQYRKSDWKERDTWMNLSKIYELAGVKEGSHVADIGCHEGYLSFHLSDKVGATGKVVAVDVRNDRLNALKEHIAQRKLKNIVVTLGDYDNPKLKENSLDVVIIMDTYHEITEYKKVLKHVKKALKPSGRLLILEKLKKPWKDKSRKEQVAAHTLSIGYVKEELKEVGFSIVEEVKDFGVWNNEPHKKMWIVVGVPKT